MPDTLALTCTRLHGPPHSQVALICGVFGDATTLFCQTGQRSVLEYRPKTESHAEDKAACWEFSSVVACVSISIHESSVPFSIQNANKLARTLTQVI